jgi:uncharacterized protein (TIGR03086 family)
MRRLIVSEFVTLDGVMEAPGGEPTHPHSGWVGPYFCPEIGEYKLAETLAADSLLLGRVTYEGFSSAWPERGGEPFADKMNSMPKHVASTTLAAADMTWNAELIEGDVANAVRAIKAADGGPILVAGSGTLVHTLLLEGLVDELRLMVFPVSIGHGLRVFPDDRIRLEWAVIDSQSFPTGAMVLTLVPPPSASSDTTPAGTFRRVAAGFSTVVEAVAEAAAAGDDAWANPAPCEGWAARDVVRHLVSWIPAMFAQTGVVAPADDLVDRDPAAAWAHVRDEIQGLLDDAYRSTRDIEFGPAGTHPVSTAVGRFVTPDVLVHTWDLARSIGLDVELDPTLSTNVLEGFQAMGEVLVASGHYAAAVAVDGAATVQTRLIAASGRHPDWTAPQR